MISNLVNGRRCGLIGRRKPSWRICPMHCPTTAVCLALCGAPAPLHQVMDDSIIIMVPASEVVVFGWCPSSSVDYSYISYLQGWTGDKWVIPLLHFVWHDRDVFPRKVMDLCQLMFQGSCVDNGGSCSGCPNIRSLRSRPRLVSLQPMEVCMAVR